MTPEKVLPMLPIQPLYGDWQILERAVSLPKGSVKVSIGSVQEDINTITVFELYYFEKIQRYYLHLYGEYTLLYIQKRIFI